MKKIIENKNWLKEAYEDALKRRGEYVKSRYYVVEVTPTLINWENDGHGRLERVFVPSNSIKVSEYFDTFEDALEFKSMHLPGEDNELEIRKQDLYRKVVETWH